MDEHMREQIALFRFGLIAPLLNEQVDPKSYLTEMANRIHEMPYYGEKRIAAKTIQDWYLRYRKMGFEGLKPKKRSDRGHSRKLIFQLPIFRQISGGDRHRTQGMYGAWGENSARI